MNKLRNIFSAASLLALALPSNMAAQMHEIKGTVTDPVTNKPISGAVISASGLESSITTDSLGCFSLQMKNANGQLSVWYPGYFKNEVAINGRSQLDVRMMPETMPSYVSEVNVPFRGYEPVNQKQSNLYSLQKKDMKLSASNVEALLWGIPGLQITQKSGMPGEGSYFKVRGNNSYLANNNPLIVIDGVPYLPDMEESAIIGGYSKSILSPFSATDIESITLLKGADAAVYGSMASNGVILIETDKASDMETKVEFIGQYGFNMNQNTMPVMGVSDYKTYVGNLALTQYSDMNDVLSTFPYLVDDPDYYYRYLYNNNTDWQDQIYQNGFTTDNVLKIKGGDAIAKYDISVGYSNAQGALVGTSSDKYYARVNADVNLSKSISMFTTLSLATINSQLMEQGMINETNPMLAAWHKAPIFTPKEKDADGNFSPNYSPIRDISGNLIANDLVSNPLAVVETVEGESQVYDAQAIFGLKAKVNSYLSLLGKVGMNYAYNRQSQFVPGMTNNAIMPTQDGLADNASFHSTGKTFNVYWSASANYNRRFNDIHELRAVAGIQSAVTGNTLDAAGGRNTSSDYYKAIKNTNTVGRVVMGYDNNWNWLNMFVNAQYTYCSFVGAGVTLSYDGSSSIGEDASQMNVYPGVNAALYLANLPAFNELNWLDKANLRAEFTSTGNSRFDSNISKYYYQAKVFRDRSSLIRSGIPNTNLKGETTNTFDLGLDFAALDNRVSFTVDYYRSLTSDLILPKTVSASFGESFVYDNCGEVLNTGVELGVKLYPVMTKDITWMVGATVTKNKNEVKKIPGSEGLLTSFADGSAVVTEKGSQMFSFYGYKTQGVFATTADAEAAALTTPSGTKFAAGDVRFVDKDGNGVINDKDRYNLGSAAPDYFGNIYTTFRYKALEVSANFSFSQGNKMYNAVRRDLESMSDYGNQLKSVTNRWSQEGQITNMPRAVYGDPMGNSRFSDRWIEDASYIKLKELMVSYHFNVLNGLTVYAAGENLFTITDYLGCDPETMYSYDAVTEGFDNAKLALPRTVKLGVKLQF